MQPKKHNFNYDNYDYDNNDYYEGNNLDSAIAAVEDVIQNHVARKEMYKAQSQQLTWRFSPYNPENQKAWIDMLNAAVPLSITNPA
jgi:23S rRNA A1618 N6-methylase RlmF